MAYSTDLLNQYICNRYHEFESHPRGISHCNVSINKIIMFKKLKKNNLLKLNQLRSKLYTKNLFSFTLLKLVQLRLNLNKLKSFTSDIIIEGLFLLEFLGSLKSAVTYDKKLYQKVNVQLSVHLRDYFIFYFLFILNIFYFPVLLRRNESVVSNFDQFANHSLTLTNINMLPFIPDIFFK